VKARVMKPDGTYFRRTPSENEDAISVQQWLLANSNS